MYHVGTEPPQAFPQAPISEGRRDGDMQQHSLTWIEDEMARARDAGLLTTIRTID